MWGIWKARNDLVFNRNVIEAKDTIERAVMDTKEWLEKSVETDSIPSETTCRRSNNGKWEPPPRGWVKCNYDASHHTGNYPSGLGWIIRNSNGTVLECGMGKFQGRATVEESECTTLIWALQSSWGLGYRSIEFEGDNLTINRLINGNAANPRLQHYLDTIRTWKTIFTSVTFRFRSRESNECADMLARKALTCNSNAMLFYSCPLFLANVVNSDIGY